MGSSPPLPPMHRLSLIPRHKPSLPEWKPAEFCRRQRNPASRCRLRSPVKWSRPKRPIVCDCSRKARIPGFRPGRCRRESMRARFKDQILQHDVAHDLVPRAVDEAPAKKGVELVSTPDIREVVVEEGKPMTFTATFDTPAPSRLARAVDGCPGRPSAAVADNGGRRCAAASAAARRRVRAGRKDVASSTATSSRWISPARMPRVEPIPTMTRGENRASGLQPAGPRRLHTGAEAGDSTAPCS